MVLWKDEEFNNKGIIVEKTPNIVKGKKRIESHEIEGRNGVLFIDKGTYDPFVITLDCHFNTDTYSIEEIKEFLDGYGTLSFDGEKEYTAIISNQIDFEKVSMFRKFPVQFLVNPIATDIESTTVQLNSETLTISGATTNMYPIIKIQGSGDVSISVNNKTFYLYELESNLTYILDCENKEIVDSLGRNCSSKMKYDFPYLKPNTNTITHSGSITSIEIEYKKAYL